MSSEQPPKEGDPNFLSIPTNAPGPSSTRTQRSNSNPRRIGGGDGSQPSTANASAASLQPENQINTQASTRDSRPSLAPTPSARQTTFRRIPRESWQPSIRIRRLSSSAAVPGVNPQINTSTPHISINNNPASDTGDWQGNRRRSSSEPQRPVWLANGANATEGPPRVRPGSNIPDIIEEASPASNGEPRGSYFAPIATGGTDTRSFEPPPLLHQSRTFAAGQQNTSNEYESNLVDFLDLVDPEVSALTSLTNMQNSLFIPYLGNLFNRNPTYNLSRRPTNVTEQPIPEDPAAERKQEFPTESRPRPQSRDTGAFTLTGSISNPDDTPHYAVLPEGISLEGWSSEDKEELNDHVRHLLHSRREGFKRAMKGFGKYVRRPLGFFVTLYATLITLFGLAWVLFLIGWINVQGRQSYLINVIDNVLVALFAIMGDGLAPFRAVDTYHMIYIAHYHHLTWRLRKEQALPKLEDHNDLPATMPEDVEDAIVEEEVSVLTPAQQKKLAHHQKKFNRSHTFYKPHETTTHHAFPLRLLVAIVVLLDCHSLLQIALGACTWSISYHVRPFALTTVILCCSISVNITAGVLISIGDHKTRKKDVLEKMFKQDLTKEAIHRMEKKKEKEREEELEAENRGEDGRKSKDLRRSLDFRRSLDIKRIVKGEHQEHGNGDANAQEKPNADTKTNADASGGENAVKDVEMTEMDGKSSEGLTSTTGNSSTKEL